MISHHHKGARCFFAVLCGPALAKQLRRGVLAPTPRVMRLVRTWRRNR